MANNTETVAVKTEFVDIVTEGELLLSPISATFSTIITEASLVEVPPAEGPINGKTITTLHDKVFVDAMSYRAFTKNKLRPWEKALKHKHFNMMYTNHWSLFNTMRKLCQQAQALLKEANILTGRDFMLQQGIETHVSKITRTKLRKRLHEPTLFCSKETPIPPPQPQALTSSLNLSAHWHHICYMRSGEPMRCYECNSLSHIKWNCQRYVCPLCGQRQLGHAQKNCPDHYHDDRTWGYFNIEGGKPVIITEKVKTLTAFRYSFKNQMVWLWNFFLSFFPSHFFISICSPSLSHKHLNLFLQLLYWNQPLLQPLNNTTPLLFWQNIPSGICVMPISSFQYEEFYMVYIGDISKTHHSFKK